MPDVAVRIMSIANNRLDFTFRDLESTIELDPGLAAKVLKIANSALYARRSEIATIRMAVTLLGHENIRSFAMLVIASDMLTRLTKLSFFSAFWRRSVHTAFLARNICRRIGLKHGAETAFLGALLHDVGQLGLFSAAPGAYSDALDTARAGRNELTALEIRLFEVDHRELGASVLEAWQFPPVYVDIAREHGSLHMISEFRQLVLVVSVADLITDALGLGFCTADEKALGTLARLCRLRDDDIRYYRDNYLADIRDDPLFRQCRDLFGF